MSFLILLCVGAAAGLLMAIAGKPGERRVFIHVVIGIVGAMLGGILVARLLSPQHYDPERLDFASVGLACAGALLFLGIAKVVARLVPVKSRNGAG